MTITPTADQAPAPATDQATDTLTMADWLAATGFVGELETEIRADGTGLLRYPDGSERLLRPARQTMKAVQGMAADRWHSYAVEEGRTITVLAVDPKGSWPILARTNGTTVDADKTDPAEVRAALAARPTRPRPRPQPQPEALAEAAGEAPAEPPAEAPAEAPARVAAPRSGPVIFQPQPQGPGRWVPAAPSTSRPAEATTPTAAPPPARPARPATAGREVPSTPVMERLYALQAPPAPPRRGGAATMGWRGQLNLVTRGHANLGPNDAEHAHRVALRGVRRPLRGECRWIAVSDPKGGVGKTTTAMRLALELGRHRGRDVLVLDCNQNAGTLRERAIPPELPEGIDPPTALDLYRDREQVRAGAADYDLSGYVWPQEGHFDVLVNPASEKERSQLGVTAFDELEPIVSGRYRIVVCDMGNGLTDLWWRVMRRVNELVVPMPIAADTLQLVTQMLVDLMEEGGHYAQLVREAVTVLIKGDLISGAPSTLNPWRAHERNRLERVIREGLGRPDGQPDTEAVTRALQVVPTEPALAGGRLFDPTLLADSEAWLQIAHAVVDGL